MIQSDEIIKIGKFNKPHGIKGELSFSITNDSFDRVENPFLICEMDGIWVPFRLEACRFTAGSTALVKLRTIDSDLKARRFTQKEVYFPKNQIADDQEDAYDWDDFTGFTILDKTTGEIGIIVAVDDSTMNTLFIVEQNGKERYIPAAEEIINRIDEKEKRIYMELPEVLLEIQ